MFKSAEIAEWLFQKRCSGYAMSVTTSTNILCISHSFFCKHLSKSQKGSCGKGKMQAEILQTCFGEDEMRIKSKSISILKYLKGHLYMKNRSNIKYWQPLLYVACYMSDYKPRLNEWISSSSYSLNVLWAKKIIYINHRLGLKGSVILLWFCHYVSRWLKEDTNLLHL